MEYHLCKDNGNMFRCDFDCRRCANLVHDALTDENKKLKDENKELIDKCQALEKKLEWANETLIRTTGPALFQYSNGVGNNRYGELSDKIESLKEEKSKLEKENDKLRDDNQRFAHECRYYIERESNLVKENDKLRTMNSDLLYRNGLLMKTTAPNIFQKVYIYDELNDKIESLKEDIIRLDKCLSNRQCVKEERYGE